MRSTIRKWDALVDNDRGVAFIEFLICIPLFVTLFMGLMESARWFEAQMVAERVAYEAARYASTLDDLSSTGESDIVSTASNNANLQSDQIAILRRVRANLALMDGGTVDADVLASHATVSISFNPSSTDEQIKPIVVRVRMPYTPLFKIFPVTQIAATGRSNYMWKTIN